MNLSDFSYDLPKELIAQIPLKERTNSKLLVLDKGKKTYEHKKFIEIIDYFEKGDCLVLNDTRVIPARLIGEKEESGGKIECLLLKKESLNVWEVMVKPGRKAKIGTTIVFGDGLLKAKVIDIVDGGNRIVEFEYEGVFEAILDELGQMPLPPYITTELKDKERYQTVYSKYEGSSAAPTAGLHFTEEYLQRIKDKGINIVNLTLHVGLGTFRPVKVENIKEHLMHSEYYEINQETADIINQTKLAGKKVIAVGTTSTRTLETVSDENGFVKASSGWTDIFIYPGYQFKIVDCLITNFHLPESTLLMLVSAFSDREFILQAYEEAVKHKYRFFSFGDAMLIK